MRAAWFYGNPNETATLLGLLMVALWALWDKSKIGFRWLLGLNLILGIALFATASRGGIVSAGGALLYLIGSHGIPRGQRRLVATTVGVGLLIFIFSISSGRFAKAIKGDASVQNRLVIWKEAPHMMVDAPSGWENPAEAFHQYYQPVDRGESYKHLVNSHLTWLVSFPWWGRILYLSAWTLGLLVFLSQEGRVRVAGAVWLCFGLNAFFSAVASEWTLWLIPLLATIYATLRPESSAIHWITTAKARLGIGLGLLVYGIIIAVGHLSPSSIAKTNQGSVRIRGSGEVIALWNPQKGVLGEKWGHLLRKSEHQWIVGEVAKKTVCVGDASWQGVEEGVWLNPSLLPDKTTVIPPKGIVILGEFFRPAMHEEWRRWIQGHPGWRLQVIEGAREYLPNWINFDIVK